MRFLVTGILLFVTLLLSAARAAVAYGEVAGDLAEWLPQRAVEVSGGEAVIGDRDGDALIVVPGVGGTREGAVYRIALRRWWTALRLSTLRCPVAGAEAGDGLLCWAVGLATGSRRLEFGCDGSGLSSAGQRPDGFSASLYFSNDLATVCPLNGVADGAYTLLALNHVVLTRLPAAGVTSASFPTMPARSILEPTRQAGPRDGHRVAVRASATGGVGVSRVRYVTSEVRGLSGGAPGVRIEVAASRARARPWPCSRSRSAMA